MEKLNYSDQKGCCGTMPEKPMLNEIDETLSKLLLEIMENGYKIENKLSAIDGLPIKGNDSSKKDGIPNSFISAMRSHIEDLSQINDRLNNINTRICELV